jgi:hypothetical protein
MVCSITSHVQGGAGEKTLKIHVSYMLVSQQSLLEGVLGVGKSYNREKHSTLVTPALIAKPMQCVSNLSSSTSNSTTFNCRAR